MWETNRDEDHRNHLYGTIDRFVLFDRAIVMADRRYPGELPGIHRTSQSDVESYLRCGILYFKNKEENFRRSTIRMAIGTAVAAAADRDNKNKIAKGVGCKPADIVEIGVDAYETESRESAIDASQLEIGKGKDDVVDASKEFACVVSKRIGDDVVASEEAITARVDHNIELSGRPDLIQRGVIRDLKTGQPWTQARVDASRQLTAYDLLYQARYGKGTRRVAIDSIYRSNSGWKSRTLWSSRDKQSGMAYVDILRRVRDAIGAGVELPAQQGAWHCSRAWCPFARDCPHAQS